MCKFKDYKPEIESTRKAISLRLTYFSKPDFIDRFVSEQSEVLGDSFAVRQLTEKESEDIDVDTISHILDIPLDYVLKEKTIYIFNVDMEGSRSRVFISKYFIFIQIRAGKDGKVSIDSEKMRGFLNLENYTGAIDLMDVSMCDDYVFGCERGSLWDVLDKSAFGDVDVDNVVDCRYADTHNRGVFIADLVRTIQKGFDDENKEIYQIFLKSIVSVAEVRQECIATLREKFVAMKTECEHEVTRCFSESNW